MGSFGSMRAKETKICGWRTLALRPHYNLHTTLGYGVPDGHTPPETDPHDPACCSWNFPIVLRYCTDSTTYAHWQSRPRYLPIPPSRWLAHTETGCKRLKMVMMAWRNPLGYQCADEKGSIGVVSVPMRGVGTEHNLRSSYTPYY